MKVFLDDERIPVQKGWTIVRNFDEFTELFRLIGEEVEEISFDHDLGYQQRDGMDCVNWLMDLAMDHPGEALTSLRRIIFHSANTEGIKNMRIMFRNAIRHGVLHDVELVDHSCLFHTDHAVMPRDFKFSDRTEV